VTQLLVIRTVASCLRGRGVRRVRGANCATWSDRADCDPYLHIISP